jgi:hypothetical protein
MKEKQLYGARKYVLPTGCIDAYHPAKRIFRRDFNAVVVRIETLTID